MNISKQINFVSSFDVRVFGSTPKKKQVRETSHCFDAIFSKKDVRAVIKVDFMLFAMSE